VDGSAINEISKLTKETLQVERDEFLFSPLKLNPVFYNPTVRTIEVHSLSGIIDFMKTDTAMCIDSIIHITDYNSVMVLSPVIFPHKNRECYVEAVLRNYNKFDFGTFMDHEKFIIDLLSMFEDSEDRQALIAYSSKLTSENNVTVTDNGISQQAQVRKGISGALKDNEKAPSIVTLTPFRTFREIQQPSSQFLFRIKEGSGVPRCALFEADGARWKDEAVHGIAEYLKTEMEENGLTYQIIK
jgi:hypothetical protein